MKTFKEFNEQTFDSYYAKSLTQGAMIQIKSKILNAPRPNRTIYAIRNNLTEKGYADAELDYVLKKWGDRGHLEELTKIFWDGFKKDIVDNRYI